MKSDLIDVTMKIHHQTERAVFASDDGDVEHAVWLPLSQVEVSPRGDGTAEIAMPEWLARERGLV